ncbi:hypothetical protein ABL78_6224 [Leptomonas seymouri]|uniref:Uncharacterized protein n=1 Tax=Leptomonas seymouri TaxID=5684 RepID=A0A0N1I2E3_LEPSE|nr:hypothetical protein ABL78_6224 [Leptomonas seymouri]|eukprot:KPI84731.1 hypothetical protein ABL78_6224 [Leptomonas seymouri]
MENVFARSERGWSDVAGATPHRIPQDSLYASALRQSTRHPHHLSHAWGAAASPTSPSLDDIRARLHDVMRSIDDTLLGASASPTSSAVPPKLRPFSSAASFDTPPRVARVLGGQEAEERSTTSTALAQRPPTHPHASQRVGASAPPASFSAPSSIGGSTPASTSWPDRRVAAISASAAAGSAHPPPLALREHTLAHPQSFQLSHTMVRGEGPQSTTAGAAGLRSAMAEEGGDEDAAAAGATVGVGLSATYKTTLAYWRSGSDRALHRALTEEKRIHLPVARAADAALTPAPAPSVVSAVSSETTASKYWMPSSRENPCSGAAATATGGARPFNADTDTFTSTCVTTAHSSRSFSSAPTSVHLEGRPALQPVRSASRLSGRSTADAPSNAAYPAVAATRVAHPTLSPTSPASEALTFKRSPAAGEVSVLHSLPQPSTSPSLSARLAVLRAADATQRGALLPFDSARQADHHSGAAAGGCFGDPDTPVPHRGTSVGMREHRDPHGCIEAALHRDAQRKESSVPSKRERNDLYHALAAASHKAAAAVDAAVTHRTSPYTRDRPPFPSPSSQLGNGSNHSNNYADEGARHTGTDGINASCNSDALVHSSNMSRADSPGSVERRNCREMRQDEASRIVALALQRQAAAEEAWRESQTRLRLPPPRPRSASPPLSLGGRSAELVPRHYADEIKGEVEGGGGAGSGCVVTTALLDALQTRLVPHTTSATRTGSGDGELPMQAELAVRERLAARRSEGAALGADDGLAHRLMGQQRQDRLAHLREAVGQEALRQLESEVARHIDVHTDAQERGQASVRASDARRKEAEELHAIRAHAEKLEKLRRRMDRQTAPADPDPAQPTRRSRDACPASAVPLPGAMASASSSLNIPEVSPSMRHALLAVSPQGLAQQHQSNTTGATQQTTAAAVSSDADQDQVPALPVDGVTRLSTAAALTATLVEADLSDDEKAAERPLSSASAASVNYREPTPERVVPSQLKRTSSAGAALADGGDVAPLHSFSKGAENRPQADAAPSRPTRAPPTYAEPQARLHVHSAQYERRESSGSEGSDSIDVSRPDWASSTQLPPSRPPRSAPPPPRVPTPETAASSHREEQCVQQAARSTRTKVAPASAGAADVVASDSPVSPAHANHPPTRHRTPTSHSYTGALSSPLPTMPPVSEARLQHGAGGGNTSAGRSRTLTGHASKHARSPTTSPRASLPIEDAERDLISSSPSAARLHDAVDCDGTDGGTAGGGDGGRSWSPERLASIQSTRLHVSPVRGTAWQGEFASVHGLGASAPLSSSSSSSLSPLTDYVTLSPIASKAQKRVSQATAPERGSQAQTRQTPARQPSTSSTCEASPHGPHAAPYSFAPAAVAAPIRTVHPLLAHERDVREEVNKRTALRASSMLMEHGVSVEVQLASRRLPAVVKLSRDREELLFYLERITEAADAPSLSSTPRTRSPATSPLPVSGSTSAAAEMTRLQPRGAVPPPPPAHPGLSPSWVSRAQPLVPGGVRGPLSTSEDISFAPATATGSVRRPGEGRLSPSSLNRPSFPSLQQPPQPSPSIQRGSLYSVAPSVRPHEGGGAGPTAAPADSLVRHTQVTRSQLSRFVNPLPGAVLPSNHTGAAVDHFAPTGQPPYPQGSSTSPSPRGPQPGQQMSPVPFRKPTLQNLHPSPTLQPHSDHPSRSKLGVPPSARAADAFRSPLPASATSPPPTHPRTVRVRELHHFPCRYARIYLPYGVVGYEEDAGFGGPGTWEDVCGILCGPASYEVLRRYSCPLFASMRVRDCAPYRVYAIIPEFQRIDVPQDAVLLVLDFKRRVDWVLFLLAMCLNMPGHGSDDSNNAASGAGTPSREGKRSSTSSPRQPQRPTLSYGRALWMLAVQRLQRARALRGVNPFESRIAARHNDSQRQATPPRQRRGLLLRAAEQEERGGTTHSSAPRSSTARAARALENESSSRPSSSPQQRALKSATRTSSPGTAPSLRFAAPVATPASLLHSPRRGRVMEQRPLRESGQPPSSLRRAPLPAAAAQPKNSRSSPVLQSSGGGRGARQSGSPQVAALRANRKVLEDFHGRTARASSTEEVPPLYAEETSKPRLRLLTRLARSLKSNRHSSVASGQRASREQK